jgi:hypothetical protein
MITGIHSYFGGFHAIAQMRETETAIRCVIFILSGKYFVKLEHLLRGKPAAGALISCSLILFSCGDFTATVNPHHNDIVKITDVNAFVTDADTKAGVIKNLSIIQFKKNKY